MLREGAFVARVAFSSDVGAGTNSQFTERWWPYPKVSEVVRVVVEDGHLGVVAHDVFVVCREEGRQLVGRLRLVVIGPRLLADVDSLRSGRAGGRARVARTRRGRQCVAT